MHHHLTVHSHPRWCTSFHRLSEANEVAEASRVLKLSGQQAHSLSAAAASSSGCNIVALALTRDNAILQLQVGCGFASGSYHLRCIPTGLHHLLHMLIICAPNLVALFWYSVHVYSSCPALLWCRMHAAVVLNTLACYVPMCHRLIIPHHHATPRCPCLQMKLQEAGSTAGAGALRTASLARTAPRSAASSGSAAAEQQLLYFFDALHGQTGGYSISKS